MPPNAPQFPPSGLVPARRMIVLVLCLSLGLHWVALQGVAWTGMIISYASEGTVVEAVQKTFDGQHACSLCQKVKQGRESDEKQPSQTSQSLKKLQAVLVVPPRLLVPAGEKTSFVVMGEEEAKRSERPAMPPPRSGRV
ncbi:MAG: hypothetical protein R3F13_08345 [Prosthecobacter sp.]